MTQVIQTIFFKLRKFVIDVIIGFAAGESYHRDGGIYFNSYSVSKLSTLVLPCFMEN